LHKEEKTKGRTLIMKKMLILVVVLLAIPAMAATPVTITCSVDNATRTVTVNYANTSSPADGNLVRGFGLDLKVLAGGNITALSNLDPNYRIYPGQIVIDTNHVRDYNTPYPGPKVLVPAATVPIEMGSLYTMDINYAPGHPKADPNLGYNAKPKTSGTLLKFVVSGTGAANGTVEENAARGGIVMEKAGKTVATPLCTWSISADCFYVGRVFPATAGNSLITVTQAMVDKWVYLGKPNCWCCPSQKRGNCVYTPSSTATVTNAIDMAKVKNVNVWGKAYTQAGYEPCCDFDMNGTVNAADLARVKNINNWGQIVGAAPPCP
jgi:hypothetical protein